MVLVVDSSGPTTYKMNVTTWYANVQVDALFNANLSSRGTLTANTLVATSNVTFNTGNTYVTANNLMIKKSSTPASAADIANASTVGLMWSDGNYIYVQANSTSNKRVAIAAW